MEIGLILGLAKVALEIFQDERRGRFSNERDKIEKEFNDEMDKPESERSDLELDRLVRESKLLGRRIIEEARKK
jgi:hypothetical protein